MRLWVHDKNPLKAPAYDRADAVAMQALAAGTADPEQQLRCVDLIVYGICAKDGQSARPVSVNDTFLAEGKRFVALQIDKLFKINPSVLDKNDNKEPRENG